MMIFSLSLLATFFLGTSSSHHNAFAPNVQHGSFLFICYSHILSQLSVRFIFSGFQKRCKSVLRPAHWGESLFSERFLFFPKWQNIIDSNSSNQWLSIILLIYNVFPSTPRFRKEAKTLKTQWWGVPWRGYVTSSWRKQKRKFFSKKNKTKKQTVLC